GRAELLADLQVLEVSHPCRRSPGPGAASVPAPRWRHRPALDHELGLALLHGLAALVQDRPLDGDDPPVELRGLALVGDPETPLDGVPDLDRALEAPAETEKRDGGEGTRHGAAAETGRDGQTKEAVSDPLPEEGRPHELRVGVEDVVVPGQARKGDDVTL